MPAHARPTLTLASALESSEPLARLSQRMRDSSQRFQSIRAALPAPLADQIKPGPIDADGWTLLAANSAVAAKLRQLVPDLQSTLVAAGHADVPIRIRILPA